jgi:hypothetical protein
LRVTDGFPVVNRTGAPADRIVLEASSGSFRSSVSASGRSVYLPRPDWRPLRPDESARLLADEWPRDSPTVTIVDLGTPALERARREIVPVLAASAGDGELRAATAGVTACMLDALRERVGLACEEAEHQAVHLSPPGLEGTAYDRGTRSYVGLHIDNEWLRGADVDHASNASFGLLGVNLGSRERYLVFVNLDAAALSAAVEAGGGGETGFTEALKDGFLERHADYPVLRLRLEPGQAYICNPQRIIHDGATNSAGAPDLSLLVFGRYAWA